jgi:D-alanyl-D-alanine carboxypeptidase
MKKNKSKNLLCYLDSFFFPLLSLWVILVLLFLGSKVIKAGPQIPEQVLGFRQLLPSPMPYPVNKKIFGAPHTSARSAIIIDIGSMKTLYEKNPDERLFPASTTKIMTALVALSHYRIDQILTATDSAIEGNVIDLEPGEQVSVENLLYGLLVGSGNDAALVLSESYPGKTPGFVQAMNQKAKEINLGSSRFTNPVGFDEPGHFSTAKDMALLSVEAIKNPIFSRIVATPELTITDITGTKSHYLKNTNELVGQVEGVMGIKTGWTENAGECLVTLTERGGNKVIAVVLGSASRFEESKSLIDWTYKNFDWVSILPANYR